MSNENKSDSNVITDEKCALNKKLNSATIRLSVSLSEPDEESCSVFDYISLIAEEKRNRRREREKNPINGPIEENNDDQVWKNLAQHFEQKYGGGGTTKKKKKKKAPTFYNYTELAAGYDESDSFIDNSEAFDEALPDEMETFHGGYYVNCGQLEFKKVELCDDNSEIEEIRVNKKKNCILKSDDSDSDDSSTKSEIDKSESVDDDVESTHKKLPEEVNHKGGDSNKNEISKINEKLKSEKSKENVPNNVRTLNGDLIKKRKKYKKRHLEDDGPVDGLSKPKKKAITVKSLLEEKRVVENGDTCGAVGKSSDARNSINDVIESVVNAARNRSEDSRDSTCSSSDTKSIDSRTSYDTEKDSHHDEMEVSESTNTACGFPNIPKEQIKLPDNLPADVLEVISQIKNSAQNSDLGVRTFFNPYINSKLLSLETKVRPLMSNARHALYGHLANFLPCSKDTLMKRAKKLLIEEEEKHMVEPFKKLKASIDKLMPVLLNNYSVACQQAEEKAAESSKTGDADEKKSSVKLPPKKFVWNEETRTCLRELVNCRLKCFHMLKPRKESSDDYVKKFLETKVKPLWPQGWMETSILWKEAHLSNNTTTNKVKKISSSSEKPSTTKKSHHSVPSSNNSSTSANSISAANFNFLSNSLTLQSLAMQYSQSDMGYPITSTSSIPYRPDLSLLTAGSFSPQNASMPYSMEFLSRLAMANNQFVNAPGHSYAKATSPPKKQSPSPVYQRSTTPHSASSVGFTDVKKNEKKEKTKNTDVLKMDSKKFNDLKKIDFVMNSAKSKKDAVDVKINEMMKVDKSRKEQIESKIDAKINEMFNIDSLVGSSTSKKDPLDSKISELLRIDSLVNSKNKKEQFDLKINSTINELLKADPLSSQSKSKKEQVDARISELMKIDSMVNANKNKKEHHMLNHISQYNKHYSHKTEKRKSTGQVKENFRSKTPASNTSSTNSAPTSAKASACEVLDLSPNKTIKSDKPENAVHHGVTEHKNDALGASLATSKDHNYWSSSKKEDIPEVREDKHEKPTALSLLQRSINTAETTVTPVSPVVVPKPIHISRKQRILQESAKSAAQETKSTDSPKSSTQILGNFKESTYINESQNYVINSSKEDDKLPSIKEEKKLQITEDNHVIEETATATDMLSKIINDTLQDNTTPLQPQFTTNALFESNRIKQEVSTEDVELQLSEHVEKPHPPSRESHTPLLDKSSPCSINSERKTPNSDRADFEAADVLKDLLMLNQIGGHNPMRRVDYQDSRYIDNRHLNSDLKYSNGSMLSQSSPHNSSSNKTSSIPRMSLTGFQDEFLQHIFKMNSDNSSYSSNSAQENCFSSDYSSLENKSSFSHTSASNKPGNTSLYNYHQSVIMPPSSLKWHIPESKS